MYSFFGTANSPHTHQISLFSRLSQGHIKIVKRACGCTEKKGENTRIFGKQCTGQRTRRRSSPIAINLEFKWVTNVVREKISTETS